MRRISLGVLKLVSSFFLGTLLFSGLALGAEPVSFTLSNGLRVIVYPNHSSHVALVLRVGAGFLDEIPNDNHELDQTGVSHELEHALFRGTARHPTREEFLGAINSIGGSYNASTNYERTNYFIVAPSAAFLQAVKLQSDQLAQPTLTDENLRGEARAVAQEILRDLANPEFALYMYSLALHHDSRRVRHIMTSTVNQTLNHSPSTLRNFYETYYSADNMTLAIVGDVGDDMDAVHKLLEKQYGRIPRRNGVLPTRPSAEPLALRSGLRMYKVPTPAASTRLLNVSFTLKKGTGRDLEAANFIAKYLDRRSPGALLQPLIGAGLLNSSQTSVENYGDIIVLRSVLDLTVAGEARINDVLKDFSSVLGALKKNGIAQESLEDLKLSYRRLEIEGAGLLGTASNLSDYLADHGADGLMNSVKAQLEVTKQDVQAVAAKLEPGIMELTFMTPNAKPEVDSANPTVVAGMAVETVNISSLLPLLRKAFAEGKAITETNENSFFHLADGRWLRARGLSLIVAPDSEDPSAEALLKFSLPRLKLSDSERMASFLALYAFRADAENAELLQHAAEAGINLQFGLDLDERVLTVTVEGRFDEASTALATLLERLMSYRPSEESLTLAKATYLERVRDLPAVAAGNQAFELGRNILEGPRASSANSRLLVDVRKQIQRWTTLANGVTLDTVNRVIETGLRSWGVQGVLAGNWPGSAVREITSLVTASQPRGLPAESHNAALPQGELPQLAVRSADYDHQGVARLFPVNVARFSNDYWAFQIFANILDERLAQVVRTELGLVYAVSAGFSPLNRGSALYMVADSSFYASRIAMAYSITLEEILGNGVSAAEMNAAKLKLGMQVSHQDQGAEGIYITQFQGFDGEKAAEIVSTMTSEQMMAIVSHHLEGRVKLDSIVVGSADPNCEEMLKP